MELRSLYESDLKDVARLHILAFPSSALTKLGVEALRRYYAWQLNGPHDSLCIGAYDDRKLKGFCVAGVFKGAETGFIKKNLLFLMWLLVIHPGLFMRGIVLSRIGLSIQVVWQLIRRKNEKAGMQIPNLKKFGILSIAVHPDHQKSGIGKLLLEKAEMSAQQKGFRSMRLTVHSDNHRAILFYEKYGWRKVLAANGVWHGLMLKEFRRTGP